MIQVIDRSFDIIEFLAMQPEEDFSLSQIAEACGIQKTTAVNILQSLEARGYVAHHGRMKGYHLGYKVYAISGTAAFAKRIEAVSQPEIEAVFNEFSETVVLATERRGKRVIISNVECQQGITARVSHSDDLYRAATGRIMLAYYPEKKLNVLINRIGLPDPFSWEGIYSRENLLDELAAIREEGVSVVYGQFDIIGIAVPILVGSNIVASLGVCLPAYRCSTSTLMLMRDTLDRCAARIAAKLK